jgi:DNA-directed RNA polymerase specialized sigma54-like protein
MESRNEPMFKVTSRIVEQQLAFFEQDEELMKPM